jgi:hypothetical protein
MARANTPVGLPSGQMTEDEILAVSAGANLSADESAFLTNVTPGTVTASKALVVGTSKQLSALGALTLDGGVTVTGTGVNVAGVVPATETVGSIFTTGSTWVTHTALGSCAMKFLTAYSGASGDYACARFRARAGAAGNVDGVNASASASVNNHGNLCAVYAAAQPTSYSNNQAAHIACGMHSVIDADAASSGRRWSTWIDDHSTTKAAAGHYLCRISQNGTVAIDGVFTIYNGGRCPVLFNFEDAAGFLTDSGDAGSTKAGYLAVTTPAGTKYIQLMTA